jgi:alpha-glucoside transport system permease protein
VSRPALVPRRAADDGEDDAAAWSADGALLGDTVVVDDVGPARRGRLHPSIWGSTLSLVPAAALVGGLVLYPVGRIVHASVTDPDGGFVGLTHYRAALDRSGVGATFVQTVVWATAVPLLVTAFGLALAVASRRRTGQRSVVAIWALTALVAPIAMPLVVTGVVFRLLYDPDPDRGTGTALLGWLLPGSGPPPALLGPRLITMALMSAFVWAWLGLAILVFRRALDRLPPVLVDVVRAHRGGWWAEMRHARWHPLLRRTSAIVFALVALATVRSFDLITVMAPGSVVDEASVLSVLQWQTSAGETTGPSAALGVLWLLLLLAGVALAAVGTRQSWPAPKALDQPAPVPAAPVTGSGARVRLAVRWTVATAVAALWAVPVLVLAGTSLHDPVDAATRSWWQPPFSFASYGDAFAADRGLWRSCILTAVLALSVTVIVVVVALLAAYALAWIGPPGAHVAGLTLLGAAVVPLLVITGPINEVLDAFGLAGGSVALGLVHAALGLPLAVLVLRNALSDLPRQVVRDARLGQGRELHVLGRLLRQASLRTALVAVAVLQFVQVWNDFVVGLAFGGPDAVPLGVLVHGEARGFVTSSGPLAAMAVLVSAAPVLLVGASHRWLVAGLAGGAHPRADRPPGGWWSLRGRPWRLLRQGPTEPDQVGEAVP